MMNRIQWEIRVPLYRNHILLRGVLLMLCAPCIILVIFFFLYFGGNIAQTDVKYAVGLLLILYVLTILLVIAVFGGKFAPGFIIDDKGIVNYADPKPIRHSRFVKLLVMMRLFKGNYSTNSMGFISYNRQLINIRWNDISRVYYYPNRRVILVQGGFAEKIALFCTKKNYSEVEKAVRAYSEVNDD